MALQLPNESTFGEWQVPKFKRGGAVSSSKERDRLHASVEVHDRGHLRGYGNGKTAKEQLGLGCHVGLWLQSFVCLI